MGMDGLFRPSQLQGYLDTVGYRNGADKATEDLENTYGISPHRKVEHVGKERHEDEESRKQKHAPQAPTRPQLGIEDELIELLETQFGLVLDPTIVYRFAYDDALDHIILKDGANQTILLTLTPNEFIRLTEHLQHNEGVMGNWSV